MKLKLAIAGALFAALIAFVPAALAHSRPIRLDPAPGSVLTAAPSLVQGWFTNELRRDPNWTFIQVVDEQGNRVDTGDIILSTDRRQMSVNLKPGLSAGRYTVTWRGFDDADGAIFGDCYTFFVGQAAADAAVTAKTRLDGGGTCQRIDVSARDGTPVPGVTPAASAGAADDHVDDVDSSAHTESDDGTEVSLAAVIIAVAAALAVGGVGGNLLGRRS